MNLLNKDILIINIIVLFIVAWTMPAISTSDMHPDRGPYIFFLGLEGLWILSIITSISVLLRNKITKTDSIIIGLGISTVILPLILAFIIPFITLLR